MNESINQFYLNKIFAIKELIKIFDKREIPINQFISKLEFLIKSVNSSPEEKKFLYDKWCILEDNYAVALDRGELLMSEDLRIKFETTLFEIILYIDSTIKK